MTPDGPKTDRMLKEYKFTDRTHPTVKMVFALMRKHGKSQHAMSRLTGIHNDGFRDWRMGKVPNVESICRCLEVLGYELDVVPKRTGHYTDLIGE